MTSELFDGILPFVEVAEAKSFRAAAARLGVTPAAVSKSIQRLEQRVGLQLLHRTTRKVRLSEEGEIFYKRCREAVAQIRAGHTLLELQKEAATGSLTVSMSLLLGQYVIRQLPGFTSRYPSLRLHIRFTDRLSRLVDDQVDVAVRIGDLEDSSLVAKKLMQTRWCTFASPLYLAKHGIPSHPHELLSVHSAHRCAKFFSPRGTLVDWRFLIEGVAESVPVPAWLDVDQGNMLIEAALAGVVLAQAPHFLVAQEIKEGRLQEVLAPFQADGPPIHALCLQGQQQNPRIRTFLDFLSDVF